VYLNELNELIRKNSFSFAYDLNAIFIKGSKEEQHNRRWQRITTSYIKVVSLVDLVILAGDANVGKTHIVYRFIKNGNENFKNMAPTVGV